MIKTWQQRCEDHPDHEGIVTEQMIRERMQEEIDELRQALAQPEHEPVGWYDSISGLMDFTFYRPVRKPSSPSAEWVPVYAAPTKREWVGLTESEIVELVGGAHALYERLIVRDVEAKLKEKNT